MHKKFYANICAVLSVLVVIISLAPARALAYDPGLPFAPADVECINKLITNNGLALDPVPPATATDWVQTTGNHLVLFDEEKGQNMLSELDITYLTGEVDLLPLRRLGLLSYLDDSVNNGITSLKMTVASVSNVKFNINMAQLSNPLQNGKFSKLRQIVQFMPDSGSLYATSYATTTIIPGPNGNAYFCYIENMASNKSTHELKMRGVPNEGYFLTWGNFSGIDTSGTAMYTEPLTPNTQGLDNEYRPKFMPVGDLITGLGVNQNVTPGSVLNLTAKQWVPSVPASLDDEWWVPSEWEIAGSADPNTGLKGDTIAPIPPAPGPASASSPDINATYQITADTSGLPNGRYILRAKYELFLNDVSGYRGAPIDMGPVVEIPFIIGSPQSPAEVHMPPTITTPSLPDGYLTRPYNATVEAIGDTPIRWSVESGALPAGITLSADGVLSGRPAEVGRFTVNIRAENAYGYDTREYTITIAWEEEDSSTGSGQTSSGGQSGATGGSGSGGEDNPKTGDAGTEVWWILALGAVAAIGITALGYRVCARK